MLPASCRESRPERRGMVKIPDYEWKKYSVRDDPRRDRRFEVCHHHRRPYVCNCDRCGFFHPLCYL